MILFLNHIPLMEFELAHSLLVPLPVNVSFESDRPDGPLKSCGYAFLLQTRPDHRKAGQG